MAILAEDSLLDVFDSGDGETLTLVSASRDFIESIVDYIAETESLTIPLRVTREHVNIPEWCTYVNYFECVLSCHLFSLFLADYTLRSQEVSSDDVCVSCLKRVKRFISEDRFCSDCLDLHEGQLSNDEELDCPEAFSPATTSAALTNHKR